VVVDASKHASLPSYLRHHEPVDLRLNPHGAGQPWGGPLVREDPAAPESDDPGSVMDRFSRRAVGDAVDIYNTSFFALRQLGVPYHGCVTKTWCGHRSDTCGRSPQRPISALTTEAFSFLATATFADHPFAWPGNPMRFQHGRMPVRLDDEWLSALSTPRPAHGDRLDPALLIQFGYLRPGARR